MAREYFTMAPANERELHILYLFFAKAGQDPDEALIEAIEELPDCQRVTTGRHPLSLEVVRDEHPAEPGVFELALIQLANEFIGRLYRAGKLPR